MQLGVSLANYTWSQDQSLLGDTFGLIVGWAERAGFASLWLGDHFYESTLICL